jgi:hypothetical protein
MTTMTQDKEEGVEALQRAIDRVGWVSLSPPLDGLGSASISCIVILVHASEQKGFGLSHLFPQ